MRRAGSPLLRLAETAVKQRVLQILWPAFLVAGVLEMLVFAVINPHDLRWFGGASIGWEPVAIYSVTFLMFWAAIATAGALTALLAHAADELDRSDVGSPPP